MLAGFGEYWHTSPPVNELVAAWMGSQSGTAPPAEGTPDLLDIIPRRE